MTFLALMQTTAWADTCGLLALRAVVQVVDPGRLDSWGELDLSAPPEGLSLAELEQTAAALGLDWIAADRYATSPWPVPAVAHAHGGHFLALLEHSAESIRVYDPATGQTTWKASSELQATLSGRVLLPASQRVGGWHRLEPALAATTRGRYVVVVPFDDRDDEDCPKDEFVNEPLCPDPCDEEECGPGQTDADQGACTNCSSGLGLPVWRVSEPHLNLWIIDKPLFYTTSHDDRLVFKLTYRQRNDPPNTNFFGLGPGWECNWRSHISVVGINTNLVEMAVPGGGRRFYNRTTQTTHTRSGTRTTTTVQGYAVTQVATGAQRRYESPFTVGQQTYHFTTERTDPKGRTVTFAYAFTNNVFRLVRLIDADGLTNYVRYGLAERPYLITEVENPFGRKAFLNYDGQGRLTNIVDMHGLSASFVYDGQGLITQMITPYGTNTFQTTTNTSTTTNIVRRSVLVTDAANQRQLYVYRQEANHLNDTNSTPLLPDAYPAAEVPDTSPLANAFENSGLSSRSSFHWGRQQYAALSQGFRNNPASFRLLTTNDYLVARVKHWLWKGDVLLVGQSPSLIRLPSPDGPNGNQPGQLLWFDYDGRVQWTEGTNPLPRLVARVLPDATTQFTYVERNTNRRPTLVVSTFSTHDNTARLRTNTFTYAANNLDLLAVREQPGNTLLLGLGDYLDRLPRRITNALNEVTVLTYDAANRQITSITRPTGLITTNSYFTTGFHKNYLQQTRDYAGAAEFGTYQFTYTNGMVRTLTDPRGLQITLGWDALDRLTNATFPNGSFRLTYDKLDLVEIKDRLGFTNRFEYDGLRRLERRIDPLNRTNSYTYCSCGSPESFTDALGRTTSYLYDYNGRLVDTLHPGGYLVSRAYDRVGRLTNLTDNAGASLTNWFNNQGLLVASSNRFGRLLSVTYDHRGRATNQINSAGVLVTNTYDLLNRPLTRRYPDGGVERFFYSVRGLTNHTDPANHVTHFYYDAAGRLTNQIRLFGGSALETNRFVYNTAGDLTQLHDGKNQLTRWNYDQYGRVTNKIDAAGITNFVYTYDANDRVTLRRDALQRQTQFQYDPVGNLTNVVYPGQSLHYAFDALNRLTNMVDAVGTSRFSYATNGLLAAEDGPWDADTVRFDYGTARLRSRLSLLQHNGSDWVQDYAYDAARRLTNVVSPAGAFGYDYSPGVGAGLTSASSLIRKLTLPGGAYITNTFESVGRVATTQLRNAGDGVLNSHGYLYDLAGRRTKQTLTDGNYLDYTYDGLSQLQSATGKESGGTVRLHEKFGYGYDPAGNLSKRTNNALVQTFNVNNRNQLTTATRSGTLTVAGTSSETATSVTVNGQAATRYTDKTFARAGFSLASGNNTFTAIAQDALGRRDTNAVTVNLPATVSFHYDPKGNLTNDGRRIFTYDDENQLVSVVVTNGVNDSVRSQFEYDGLFRRRVRKEYRWQGGAFVQTDEVRYVYDGRLPIQERNAYNLPLVTYTRGTDLSGSREEAGGIGGLLARSDMTQLTPAHAYYHADGNGNVTALVNAQQRIAARYLYDPYGNVVAMSGPLADANLYRFSSKEVHPVSGLVYYLYRYYDPNLQRWVNRDPIGEAGGLNLYQFVRNDPLGFVDPLGLFIWDEDEQFPVLTGNPLAAYLYDRKTKDWHDEVMRQGWQAVDDFGRDLAYQTALSCVPFARLSTCTAGRLIAVSRWGRPGLQPGDWVMRGSASFPNYLLSGKWDPFPWNQFARFGSGVTYYVVPGTLAWPPGLLGIYKGLLGQRLYMPWLL
jgi:RHS repeat-associated protein